VTGRDELIRLARSLHEHAILAEGNVACRLGDDSMLVKASGASLAAATTTSFVAVPIATTLGLLDGAPTPDPGDGPRPSVEAPMHAVLLEHAGAQVVGHTHPEPVNAILCSERAPDIVRALFPDQIVVCGADPLYLPYVDPGLPLARALRAALAERARPPRTIYLGNHGLVALGQSAQEVLQITAMAVKAARILLGAYAAGGPTFMPDDEVAHIDGRLDEHYRRDVLARGRL
jgi:rhamnose utilization protein RhaD (predicted bifunctional aldolase and dehydrogenase)